MLSTNRLPLSRYLRPACIGLVYLGVVSVLLAVMSLYLKPTFLLTLANQVWGCF